MDGKCHRPPSSKPVVGDLQQGGQLPGRNAVNEPVGVPAALAPKALSIAPGKALPLPYGQLRAARDAASHTEFDPEGAQSRSRI